MRIRVFGVLFLLASVLTASAQNGSGQSTDTLQALKDSLSPDQQSSIMQGVLGKIGGSGRKTDPKLRMPETVQSDLLDSTNKYKTRDGRILRQADEDPELRPDDFVMIEMTSVEVMCKRRGLSGGNADNSNNPNSPSSGAPPAVPALGSASTDSPLGSIAGAGLANPNNNTAAINAKLDALILAVEGADNSFIGVEDKTLEQTRAVREHIASAVADAESAASDAQAAANDAHVSAEEAEASSLR